VSHDERAMTPITIIGAGLGGLGENAPHGLIDFFTRGSALPESDRRTPWSTT
jgi:hypothetical protein